ncbi:MAG: hypothetical protein K2X03_21720 [Bryobacteraceae bacterium]|nr:hypothetical protein [Bryobacteraceae bacterium]
MLVPAGILAAGFAPLAVRGKWAAMVLLALVPMASVVDGVAAGRGVSPR